MSIKRPVIREDYNELVFFDPNPKMAELLKQNDLVFNNNEESQNVSAIDETRQDDRFKPIDRQMLERGY